MMNRRQFLGRAGAGAALSYVGASALLARAAATTRAAAVSSGSKDAAVKNSMQYSWVMDAEFSGYFVAIEKGYYAAEGLETTPVAGGPSVAVEGNVQAGKSLFGLDAADTITKARLEGAPFVMLGAQFQKNPLGVMSLKEKNILKPRRPRGEDPRRSGRLGAHRRRLPQDEQHRRSRPSPTGPTASTPRRSVTVSSTPPSPLPPPTRTC